MEPTDFIFSAVLFTATIIFVFYSMPHFLPAPSETPIQSQIDEVMNSVTTDIDVQTVVLKADCDSELYDCNYNYPIEIDINSAYINMYSQYFSSSGNKLYSIGTIGEEQKIYLFPASKLTTDYNTSSLDLSLSSEGDTRTITNQYLTVTLNPRHGSVDFSDSSETDLLMSYDEMDLNVFVDTESLVKIGDENKEFYFYFFPGSAEFWIDITSDYNLEINPAQRTWRTDANTGSISENEWYTESGNTAWHYRIPITVNSLDHSGTGTVLQQDINFPRVKALLGMGGYSVDTDSFRMIEYSNGEITDSSVPFAMDYGYGNPAVLKWQLTGETAANTLREYALYFDFTTYPKTAATETDLTYVELEDPVYISQAQPEAQSRDYSAVVSSVVIHNPNTISIEAENAYTRSWDYTEEEYRIPFDFDSGLSSRTDQNIEATIDFGAEFSSHNCSSCVLDEESIRLIEVNNLDEGAILSFVSASNYSLAYDSQDNTGTLSWIVTGTTPTRTHRYYYFYFDNA